MLAAAPTVAAAVRDLATGRTSSVRLVEECLARIEDPAGEGGRAFLEVDAGSARRAADALDAMRAAGVEPSPYAGIPVAVKDLFDVRGRRTRAGSTFLDRGPAPADAAAVARWRRAGLVLLGRTNMTEFAYSGLGLNPHFGTPASPWDRERGRIPGGSSSGAAVAVADAMALGGLGSDTGGSCRIPAAFCGLTGFKPTQARVPRAGMVPLSSTLDAVGVIGRTVGCCAALYGLLRDDAAATPAVLAPASRPPRLALGGDYFLADAEPAVGAAFDRALGRLAEAGAELVQVEIPELEEIAATSAGGGFPAAESFAWHRDLIAAHADEYDPRVLSRIRRGASQSAADLLDLQRWRRRFVAAIRERLCGCDGLVCPTVPIVPPPLDAFADDREYARLNLLALRNPTVVNLFDGCAISLPMQEAGEPPSGLMLAAPGGRDERLLSAAAWVEECL
ncbi:MAG: amidase [Actinobacteria bacterium]|nr:amidase [Actinomycetota bacterium]